MPGVGRAHPQQVRGSFNVQDFKNPGSMGEQYFLGVESIFKGSGNPSYPGGQFFNMFNLGKTEAEMFKLRTNEIRNGRLAMLAMLGYGAQVGRGFHQCCGYGPSTWPSPA
jgi:hypothetical protein